MVTYRWKHFPPTEMWSFWKAERKFHPSVIAVFREAAAAKDLKERLKDTDIRIDRNGKVH